MPDGQLQVVTYQSGPFGHLANVKYERGPDTVVYPTTTPVAPTTTTEYYAASTKAPVYGTTPKPVYSTVKPYVRTSSEVKYIKRARPSYRTYPVYPLPAYSQYVMRRPTDIQAPYQHNYQPTYQSSYPTIRYPEPTYKSPSLPPYAPLQSYLPNYPPSSYRSKYWFLFHSLKTDLSKFYSCIGNYSTEILQIEYIWIIALNLSTLDRCLASQHARRQYRKAIAVQIIYMAKWQALIQVTWFVRKCRWFFCSHPQSESVDSFDKSFN